jgi:hypothetical protein
MLILLYIPRLSDVMASANAGEAMQEFEIEAILAMPYYSTTGEIRNSTNLFDPRLALRNIIIVPSGGQDPMYRKEIKDWDILFGTTVTYVNVKVVAMTRVKRPPRIELLARNAVTGREIQRQQIDLSRISSASNVWYVPFFVYGTGCEELELDVRVFDETKSFASQSRTVPFTCGE